METALCNLCFVVIRFLYADVVASCSNNRNVLVRLEMFTAIASPFLVYMTLFPKIFTSFFFLLPFMSFFFFWITFKLFYTGVGGWGTLGNCKIACYPYGLICIL